MFVVEGDEAKVIERLVGAVGGGEVAGGLVQAEEEKAGEKHRQRLLSRSKREESAHAES